MKSEFIQKLQEIKQASGIDLPTIKFTNDLRGKLNQAVEALDHYEGMLTLLEGHPFLSLADGFCLGSDMLNYRLLLVYEIILRQIGHSRSIIANANIYNHVGMSVSLRCMLELYAFVVYLNSRKDSFDENNWELLLNGSTKSSGELKEIKMVYKKYENSDLPEGFEEFFKSFMKTPQVGKYLKKIKKRDEGFDLLYAMYSQYVHPTFGPASDRVVEISKYSDIFDYYDNYKSNGSSESIILQEIKTGDFCLQMFWPEVFALDPIFDESVHDMLAEPFKTIAKEMCCKKYNKAN
jgi:hypothetical protein